MNTTPKPEATSILTAADVDALLKDDSTDSRIEVLDKISLQYNMQKFSHREREVAEQIFRLIMKDTQMQVREMLAQRICNNPDIPRDIALHLALDHDRVAVPIIEISEVLSDADLVKIIDSSRDVSKLLAISRRPSVSERVSDALVDTSYPNVISALLDNQKAEISERVLAHIADTYAHEPQVIQSMVDRMRLPVTVVERLVAHVTESVAQELKKKYKLTDAQIRKETTGAREDVTLTLLSHEHDPAMIEALVKQLMDEKRLTPSIVMTALCRGQRYFFVYAMAQLAHIPAKNVEKLITDKGGIGFRALYDRTEMPASMFEAIQILLRV
ncbi:MAG: DUF2336 domain-containing protein, partial [Rickettsiales bacterium]|nr:DUF2336 domain-containing protein [Rickettsiales bacterium]